MLQESESRLKESESRLKESEVKRSDVVGDSDVLVAEAVRKHLANSGHCGLRHLQVSVDKRFVHLAGEVSTYFLKQTAQEVARFGCPEHQIRNSIVVRAPKAGTFPLS